MEDIGRGYYGPAGEHISIGHPQHHRAGLRYRHAFYDDSILPPTRAELEQRAAQLHAQANLPHYQSDTVAEEILSRGSHVLYDPREYTLNPFSPPVDIFEDDQNVYFITDLPGFDADMIDIDIRGLESQKALAIRGMLRERGDQRENKRYFFYARERHRQGRFFREFYLPDYCLTDKITADFSRGVLKITVPKAHGLVPTDDHRKKKIEIHEEPGISGRRPNIREIVTETGRPFPPE